MPHRAVSQFLGCFVKVPKGGGGIISDPKNYIADFLVSKRYILVVNFGKNVQKGGEGGHLQSKKFIANLRKLTHIYEFLQKQDRNLSYDALV